MESENPIVLLPVEENKRIQHLDVLRGIAILGILLLNIYSFGLPEHLQEGVYSLESKGTADYITWFFTTVFFDGKMRALFCFLFGAGIILFAERCDEKGTSIWPLYRRMLWLLAFGLFDILILQWTGDILYEYALCGLLLIPLRKLKPAYLITIGLIVLSTFTFIENLDFNTTKEKREKYVAIESLIKSGDSLTAEQLTTKNEWESLLIYASPFSDKVRNDYEEIISKEISKKQVGYKETFFQTAAMLEEATNPEFYIGFLEEIAPILFGMAMFKLGWLSVFVNKRRSYWMAITGLCIGWGIALYLVLTVAMTQQEFCARFDNNIMSRAPLNQLARLLVPIGLIGSVMLLCTNNSFLKIKNTLAVTGKMAFTNYLTQSLLCTLIFNGYGLALYGKLQRYELMIVVALVWLVNIAFSSWWLKRYQLGPMEWLWRVLTYNNYIPNKRLSI